IAVGQRAHVRVVPRSCRERDRRRQGRTRLSLSTHRVVLLEGLRVPEVALLGVPVLLGEPEEVGQAVHPVGGPETVVTAFGMGNNVPGANAEPEGSPVLQSVAFQESVHAYE